MQSLVANLLHAEVNGVLVVKQQQRCVTAELESHLGISEKTLAEFIIELAAGKKSIKEFKQALAQNGAEMPESLVQTIWNVIQRLTQV